MRKILSGIVLTLITASYALAATTYTTNYNLAKPSDGSTSWGSLLRGNFDSIDTQMFVNSGSVSAHLVDAVDAHDATAISTTAGASLCTAALEVQAFLNCLDSNFGSIIGGTTVTLGGVQTITGAKTFTSLITGTSGLTITGVPTFSSLGLGVLHSSVSGVATSSRIFDADIDASASISRSKVASGTFNHVVINDASGALSSEANLALVRGGTGNATGTATINANMTGPITGTGNVTSVTSQTGTGSTFVMNTSPTIVTPNLGTPSTLVGTNITGTATALSIGGNAATATTASTVATNANMTGPITGTGNVTSITAQTGTGTTFVMQASPTLTTPNLGTPSTLVGTNITGTASALNIGGNAATATSSTTSTTATNATNGATVASTTNASYFPLFAASSTNSNQPFNLGTGLSFNPSTNLLTTTGGLSSTTLALSGAEQLAQIATPATPSSGFNKIYAKSDDKLYTLNSTGTETQLGAGSGGGAQNYVANPDFESATTGYATYADAAGTSPVDGTAGSPTVTLTRSVAATILHGTASGLITKDAANRQGEGASYAFTIDSADQAKVLQISFDYMVRSGTFVAGTDTTSSDITVWIYDVTNATIIQPSTFKLYSNSSTTSTQFVSNFQTASNSLSYRLIFHVGSTSALAYSLAFDKVSVSPTSYVYGTPITDWINYTPVISGFGTNSGVNFKSRRVGDSLEVSGYFVAGTTAASAAQIGLGYAGGAANVTVDTTKVPGGSIVGGAVQSGSSTTYFGLYPLAPATNATYINLGLQTSTTGGTAAVNGNSITTGATVEVSFQVPILGWSSSVQTSDQTDTRIVAARYSTATALAITNGSDGIIDFGTKEIDTHNAVTTGASWKYTAPVSGTYRFYGQYVNSSAALSTYNITMYKNGVSHSFYGTARQAANAANETPVLNGIVNLVSGDYIDFRFQTNGASQTLVANATNNFMTIERLSASSIISATESVLLSLNNSASITPSGTISTSFAGSATINFNKTPVKDTHGMYSSGSVTVPYSGNYDVRTAFVMSYTSSTGSFIATSIAVNGTQKGLCAMHPTAVANAFPVCSAVLQNLIAGDIITVRAWTDVTAPVFVADGVTNLIVQRVK